MLDFRQSVFCEYNKDRRGRIFFLSEGVLNQQTTAAVLFPWIMISQKGQIAQLHHHNNATDRLTISMLGDFMLKYPLESVPALTERAYFSGYFNNQWLQNP